MQFDYFVVGNVKVLFYRLWEIIYKDGLFPILILYKKMHSVRQFNLDWTAP